MDISSVGGSAMPPEVQAQYAVKCMQVLEENLEYMDENKTGALLKLSVRMGALLAKCTEELTASLERLL